MPELPEVDVMCQRLQPFVGARVHDTRVDPSLTDRARAHYLPEPELSHLFAEGVTGIHRRGKFLVFSLEGGALLCHNAMTGYWGSSDEPWTFDYVEGARRPSDSDVRVCLDMHVWKSRTASEELLEVRQLRFHDARKFGSLRFMDPEQLAVKLSALGPDAIGTPSSYEPGRLLRVEDMVRAVDTKKMPVKCALMDQSRIAGIGNIYASEICHEAGVRPDRTGDLSDTEVVRLYDAMGAVLFRALNEGLQYDKYLKVYRRGLCPQGHQIFYTDMKGRRTYWCPKCQS